MSEIKSFSKYANSYDKFNIIQKIVAKALVKDIDFKPRTILELGCGSGQIYKQISWEVDRYVAIDSSKNMCELHPKDDICQIYNLSFDDEKFYERFKKQKFDLVLSSSSLQWSKNLSKLVNFIMKLTNNFQASLFTNNTYKTIFDITKINSPILSLKEIKKAFDRFNPIYEIYQYKLIFDDKKELFRYIKNSGTSGEVKITYKQAKKLFLKYPHNYLEFEVVFVKI